MASIILRQSNVVSDPSATIKGSPLSNAEVDNNFANINISIGVLSGLTTNGKSNIVIAVNELKSNITTVSSDLGITTNLTTNGKANIVTAVNELRSNITIEC